MADTTFVAGTPVTSPWLNDINDFVYGFPSPVGNSGKALFSNGTSFYMGTTSAGARPVYYAYADYGITNDMSADVSSQLSTLINTTLPDGSTLVLDGKFKITTPLVITKNISIQCLQNTNFIWADVGSGNDAITYTGGAGGINNLDTHINLYGPASACRYGVVLSRVDRSEIHLNIRIGAVAYGVVLDGCLINRIKVVSSVNFAPPQAGYGTQLHHMLVKNNTTHSVASNTNDIYCLFEGCTDGYVQSTQPGEGSNTISGEIEGLSGNAVYVEESLGFTVKDLKLEANTGTMYFRGGRNLNITNVINQGTGGTLTLRNCAAYNVSNYYGVLDIDTSNLGGTLGPVQSPYIYSHTITDESAVQVGPFTIDPVINSSDPNVLIGPGSHTGENVFGNPYFDLWATNSSASGPPNSTTVGAGCLANRVTTPVYPGNPNIYSVRVTTSTVAITGGLCMPLSFNPVKENGYISVMVPVYVATGQPGVAVFLHDGTNYHALLYDTTTKDQWVVARGGCKMIAGNNFSVYVATWNGTTYPVGQFYVGGCSIVFGPIPPKHLKDDGRRRAGIIGNISNAPDFVGQIAKVGAGDLYMANDTASSAAWLKISP